MHSELRQSVSADRSDAPLRTNGTFLARLRWALQDEQGTASVEYALLLSLVVVATLGAWVELGAKVRETLVTLTVSISQPPS